MPKHHQDKIRAELTARLAEIERKLGRTEEVIAERSADEADEAQAEAFEIAGVEEAESHWRLKRLIEAALERLDNDEYGVCEECGRAIAARRLRAVPWAALCVACQELEERENPRGENRAEFGSLKRVNRLASRAENSA